MTAHWLLFPLLLLTALAHQSLRARRRPPLPAAVRSNA